VDTSDEWIIKRTGISERRVLDEDMPTYKLGVEAAKKALADAKVNPEEVDLIIVTTETPDYLSLPCPVLFKVKSEQPGRLPLISMLHAPDSFMACPWPISLLSQLLQICVTCGM